MSQSKPTENILDMEITEQLVSSSCVLDGANIVDVAINTVKTSIDTQYERLPQTDKDKINGEHKASKLVLDELLKDDFNHRESINNYNRDNKRDLEKELLNVMKDSESENKQIEQNLLVSFTSYLNNDINDDETVGDMRITPTEKKNET